MLVGIRPAACRSSIRGPRSARRHPAMKHTSTHLAFGAWYTRRNCDRQLVMVLESQSSNILRFGVFEADLHAGELRKQGKRIRLQEQPFQVLMALLQRPGEVVTREELRNHNWPPDSFVAFDNSLNTAINKLREALDDSADNPRFIETLPRRGYRFVAPVTGPDGVDTARIKSGQG